MSQAGIINTSSGPVPPTIATTYQTDSGSATPAANILNVLATDTTANDVDGISTSGSGNTVTVLLTNRITGTATTTDGVTPVNVYTFALGATPGTYLFYTRVVVYNLTSSLSAAYASYRAVRTDGATATVIGATGAFTMEEGAMSALLVQNTTSGNNVLLEVTGYNGDTLHYLALTEYQFVS